MLLQLQLLTEATVPRSTFLQLQGPVSFRSTAYGNNCCPDELIKRKGYKIKAMFTFPTQHFIAVKAAGRARGV